MKNLIKLKFILFLFVFSEVSGQEIAIVSDYVLPQENTPLELVLCLEAIKKPSLEQFKQLDFYLEKLNETDRIFLIKSEFYKRILQEYQANDLSSRSTTPAANQLLEQAKKAAQKTGTSKFYQWLIRNFIQDLQATNPQNPKQNNQKLEFIYPWVFFLTNSDAQEISSKLEIISQDIIRNIMTAAQIQLNFGNFEYDRPKFQAIADYKWNFFSLGKAPTMPTASASKSDAMNTGDAIETLDIDKVNNATPTAPTPNSWTPKEQPLPSPIDDWHKESDFPTQ